MNQSERTHPWTIPDIRVADPLNANQLPITPWPSLKFHPIGLLHLRRHLGVYPHIPGFFQQRQAAFEASDIAFFAAGRHRDGRHHVPHDRLHDEYLDLHAVCGDNKAKRGHQKQTLQNVLDLIFDLVSLLLYFASRYLLCVHGRQHFWTVQVVGRPWCFMQRQR